MKIDVGNLHTTYQDLKSQQDLKNRYKIEIVHIKITSITLTHRHHDLELRSWILSPFIIDN